MKRIFITLFAFCYVTGCYAQFVSKETAQKVAENFFATRFYAANRTSMIVHPYGSAENPTMYIISSDNLWVLIAADRRVQPVLAYSDNDTVESWWGDKNSSVMQDMAEWYNNQIAEMRDRNDSREYDTRWNLYLGANLREISNLTSVVVAPLIRRDSMLIKWKQRGNDSSPASSVKCYNQYCPQTTDPQCINGHMVVGCAPLALGMIMWYWRWPLVRKKSQTHDFAIYEWEKMPYVLTDTTLGERANAVATLLHDIGVEMHTEYGCQASSTNFDSVVPVLQNKFLYASSNLLQRQYYSDSAWINMIKTDLDNGRPVFYTGYANSQSKTISGSGSWHAFIIDGYDSDNKFHIYYGGGVNNGNNYLSLDAISYNTRQMMIHNIQPIDTSCLPVVIPSTDVWDTTFMIQRRGGIMVGNRTITYGMRGVIASGNYVKLTSGFKVNAGAHLYITCDSIDCDSREYTYPLADDIQPQRRIIQKADSQKESLAASKIFRDGQIYIIRGDKIYTLTGIETK